MKWSDSCYHREGSMSSECRRLKKLEKMKPGVSQDPSGGSSSSYILILSRWGWLWPSDLQNYKRIHLCGFKPQFVAICSNRNRKRMHQGYVLQLVSLSSNSAPPCVFSFTPCQRYRAAKTKVKSSRLYGPYILISCKASSEVLCLCRATPLLSYRNNLGCCYFRSIRIMPPLPQRWNIPVAKGISTLCV